MRSITPSRVKDTRIFICNTNMFLSLNMHCIWHNLHLDIECVCKMSLCVPKYSGYFIDIFCQIKFFFGNASWIHKLFFVF